MFCYFYTLVMGEMGEGGNKGNGGGSVDGEGRGGGGMYRTYLGYQRIFILCITFPFYRKKT
jgi:hypothetical protein